jgi:NTE family protein
LWRSLVAHQRYDALAATPLDHVMRPPLPAGLRITEFERHTEIFESSYRWAREAITALEAAGDPAIAAILATAKPAMAKR